MKNKIKLIAVVLNFLFIVTSCKATVENEALNIIPFTERSFIYRNNLEVEYKQEISNEDNKSIDKRYPQITGLINKEVEKKINEDIVNITNIRLTEVESINKTFSEEPEITSNSTSAYVNYNCNNVMFVDYSSYITYNSGGISEGYHFSKVQGYDLNTGNYITLKDLFKQDVDYKKILNDYIYMELIKSNYDDPDSSSMKKPFQGINENQTFSFDENRLLIIMDEKNEEFNISGYPVYIEIPLREIGEHLAIFDRYFHEGNSIFEDTKVVKNLMPNNAYYHINDGITEYEEYYNIDIEAGEFIGIEDDETNKMLDSMVDYNLDVEGFKERAKAYVSAYPEKYYGHLGHYVNVMMSEGGYFSFKVYSYKNELETLESDEKYINYDINNNKFMTLKDLFVDGFDYKSKILDLCKKNPNYNLSEDTFVEGEEILISESDFDFNENFILLKLYQPGINTIEQQLYFEFKDIGYENIVIFQ